jgi:hypothetical protein
MFIVIMVTKEGKVAESYATYEEAARRVALFPAESLTGLPLIFRELPDGSQRLVREDGKPLQWHRVPEEEDRQPANVETVPLSDEPMNLGPPLYHSPAADEIPVIEYEVLDETVSEKKSDN